MVRIGIVTISDRASAGTYDDLSGPAIEAWLRRVITSPWDPRRLIIPDGLVSVRDCLRLLCDEEQLDLILTSGGTGPAPRDLTPEALAEVIQKPLPGFGEAMRSASLAEVPTAILSRQEAGVRGRTLIIALPGKPAAIATCLNAVFAAVPYCLDLIGAGRIETDPALISAFRPRGA
ncbi:molybdopterin adenylyltransferase [Aquabacter sediminis]|jgi:molybdopterin adenylyltransferase|uniref:molybdopterin adenylyltransferase n=1 Tax=Aquabacter sediminis TaxID=3029197 RepID=UPI00237DBF7C|nr:molybdopterin adenylyltransferase [Aquabacter sp. P-9]MDE1568284.1 molybdopterin adenylyltransferase [Aquabacter sp. P-9]